VRHVVEGVQFVAEAGDGIINLDYDYIVERGAAKAFPRRGYRRVGYKEALGPRATREIPIHFLPRRFMSDLRAVREDLDGFENLLPRERRSVHRRWPGGRTVKRDGNRERGRLAEEPVATVPCPMVKQANEVKNAIKQVLRRFIGTLEATIVNRLLGGKRLRFRHMAVSVVR
jgi:hypothetical protein